MREGGGGGGGVKKGREIITYHCHAVFPSSFYFPAAETMSVNGSSATGNCSSVNCYLCAVKM